MVAINLSTRKKLLHVSLLVAAICLAYSKMFYAGFISWDDFDYVFHPDINTEISFEQIKHWFSRIYLGNYQPLPVFTYALDYQIAGTNPLVYHLHNLIWHIGASVLVYLLINKLQANKWLSFFVALLFALHPVQTESVSWIAARNKSMNAFFYFMAMIYYIAYVKNQTKTNMAKIVFFGSCAYLCKATALSLPLALIALDIWIKRPLGSYKIWLEKLPLVIAGLPVALVTLWAQNNISFLQHHSSFGFDTIILAGYALVQYAIHLLFPLNLSVLYPYPPAIQLLHVAYFVIGLGLLLFIVYAYKQQWYLWSGGILFFVVNLLPVLQLVQFGETLMADRYLYIACLGFWFPLVYSLFQFFKAYPWRIATGVSASICIFLFWLTFFRNSIWLSEINFWNSVLEKFPESAVAHYSLGASYMKEGDFINAELQMHVAIRCDPNNYKAWRNIGLLYQRLGKTQKAFEALNKCLLLYPYPKAYFTRGMLYHAVHNYKLALTDLQKMLQLAPGNAHAYYIKADCEERLNKPVEAMMDYCKAIDCDNREPLYLLHRGLLYAKLNNKQAALTDLNKAVELNPRIGVFYYYRALIRFSLGQNPCRDFHLAIQNGYHQASKMLANVCR